ncbi:ABC transporter [Kumtagia ephedrae]|jgi:uncharacterized lipoprotein YehR (DUF1307 family)|uniref:ABC transporter n=1 Tax=Kumtagia ephedrae TaxID=2116701 RepID=A0A2P7SQI4_9HYPH|nr:ABC transporter [Mesorhizobium ephedrae]PSJ64733.1 ABC transporter [Mesorhizobium ephedrae]
MSKLLIAVVAVISVVSLSGCETIGKGKGKAPAPAVVETGPAPVYK